MNGMSSINKLVADLAEAKTLEAVRLKTQKQIGDNKFRYEVVGKPSTRFVAAFVTPRPEGKKE